MVFFRSDIFYRFIIITCFSDQFMSIRYYSELLKHLKIKIRCFFQLPSFLRANGI